VVVVNEGIGQSEGACRTEAPRQNIPVNPIGINEVRSLSIQKVINGYTVVVGCRIVVFEKQEVMLKEIGRYLDNPAEVEKEYLAKK
jgi:hypothetical protein